MNTANLILKIKKLSQVSRSFFLLKNLFYYRVLAAVEHKPIFLRELNTIIDIGANRGQFSLASRFWAPQSKIIAFEPLPYPSEVFRKIFINDANVSLINAAVGPEKGLVEMHLSERDDSSSLLPIGKDQVYIFPGTQEISVLKVEVAPLSHFINANVIISPSMLKIDVQGFEMQVLKGSKNLLHLFDYIYCECSFIELYVGQNLVSDVISFLDTMGFNMAGVYNLCSDRSGRAIQADFFFIKRSII